MQRNFKTFFNATNPAENKSLRIGTKTRALKRCITTCVRVGWDRMFLCMWNGICIFLGIIFNFILIYMYSIVGELCFKNAKWLLLPWALAAGIVRCAPQSLDCWSFWNVRWKMREGETEDDRGMAMEFENMVCIQNLGGRQSFLSPKSYYQTSNWQRLTSQKCHSEMWCAASLA